MREILSNFKQVIRVNGHREYYSDFIIKIISI